MKNINLSQQKKIIIIAFVVLLANLTFWLFIYLPSKNKVSQIKSQLLDAESQLCEIETIIGKTKSIDKNVESMMERYQQLSDKFPQKEEEALRMLSYLTHKLNVKLVSIKPQPKAAFMDKGKRQVEIGNKKCQKVFVSMEMKCFYKDLVKYIETLKEALPAFVTIERLKMKKDILGAPRLNISLDINIYLLS